MGMEGHGDLMNTGALACGCVWAWVLHGVGGEEVGVGSPWAGEPLARVPMDMGAA